jgi:hypothetical protein
VVLQRFDEEGRLVPGEVESVQVSAIHVAGYGWRVAILARRQFQDWAHASRGEYERLSTEELVTVIDAALSAELRV